MKKLVALMIALCMLLAGCGSKEVSSTPAQKGSVETEDDGRTLVGIALPENAGRWAEEGEYMRQVLESQGVEVQVVYAERDPQLQNDQIGTLMGQVDCLVIGAVDSLVLAQTVTRATEAKLPVIAYDRLLMFTEGVAGYVAYDAEGIGKAMGEHIVSQKQLETAKEENRTYTVEFFMGSAEDHGALLLHQGLLSVLQPYLDSGVLTCASGRVAFEDCCVQDELESTAAADCADYVQAYYPDDFPDILCTAAETLTAGVETALIREGCADEDWPLIVGQDVTEDTLERFAAGRQSLSFYRDNHLLAQQCVRMVEAFLAGSQPEFNAPESCHNGAVTVPAYLLAAQALTNENYGEFSFPEETVPTETTEPEETTVFTHPTETTEN